MVLQRYKLRYKQKGEMDINNTKEQKIFSMQQNVCFFYLFAIIDWLS